MKPELAHEVCAALYLAAEREATEAHLTVWQRALASAPDDDVADVVERILSVVDLGARFGPPTPAMYLAERAAMYGEEPPGADRHSMAALYALSRGDAANPAMTKMLRLIAAAWPKHGWTMDTVKVAEELLEPLDAELVRGIVIYLAKSGRAFAPVPGEIYFEVVGPPTPW